MRLHFRAFYSILTGVPQQLFSSARWITTKSAGLRRPDHRTAHVCVYDATFVIVRVK